MDNSLPRRIPPQERLLIRIADLAWREAFHRGGPEFAEDLAQDVVLECLVKVRTRRGRLTGRTLKGFVRQVVRRRWLDSLRLARRRATREEEHAREATGGPRLWMSPELKLVDAELTHFHESTLASLPSGCRRSYLMVREEDASYQLTADLLGVSRATVNAHVVAAQRKFREGLPKYGITPEPPRGAAIRASHEAAQTSTGASH